MSTTSMQTPPERGNPNPDALARAVTSFATFADLTDAPDYVPTLAGEDAEELELADLYDAEMFRRGDSRRAYRGAVRRG